MNARPPDVQRLGPAVVLQGRALTLVTHLAVAGASSMSRRDGAVLSRSTRELLDVLARADRHAQQEAMSAGGHADVRDEVSRAQSEPVGSAQAAGVLGVTARQVRRLAAADLLPGRRTGREWQFELSEVHAYAAQHRRDSEGTIT